MLTPERLLEHDWYERPVPPNVDFGPRCWLYSAFAFIHYRSRRPCGVRIGADSGVYWTSFFELGPQGEVEIGDFCSLVGAIIRTNQRIVIRDYAFVAHQVVLADTFAASPELDAPWREDDPPRESIVIGENAWIGARAVLLDGARIGENAIVGAAAVVDFEVPAGAIVAGNPARIVGSVSGARRN